MQQISALLAQPLSQASLRCVNCRSSFTCDLYATAAAHRLEAIGQHAGGFGRPFFVVVSRYWNGVSKVPRDLPPMPGIRTALLLCGLGVAVALTVAWDSFLSYEFYRFAEFIF
jgi:hypothetical protein